VTRLNGIVIGQAERATRAVLDELLDRLHIPFDQWVALHLAATDGSAGADRLASLQRVPLAAAEATVSALTAAGLLAPDGSPTAAGRARHAEIAAGIAEISARLYAGFPDADLETAGRVLTEVTSRARAQLAAP
jgi:hypothetical protein